MKKALDFLIIFLLTFLIVNLFIKDEEKKLDWNITFASESSSYSIPASVWLEIINNSESSININTCEDIKVNNSGDYINFEQEFCKDIEVKSGEEISINYSEQFAKFSSIGNYVFEVELSEKRYLSQFEIENPWTIKKLFTTLFYAPIYNLMVFLIWIFWGNLWWAILSITVIIRILLLWPQHKMMLSQKKLQALQPKIKKLQEEHKWNQQVIGMKLMELYKKEKVNPMWSCGFLLIQMPILLVIYNIILSIKDISNTHYIYDFLSGFHLSDTNYIFFGIDLLWAGGITWLVLWVSVWLIQYVQVKLSLAWKKIDKPVVLEKKKWDTWYSSMMPDPDMMNKFMLYWMPAMVWVFTFTLIAWVGIYWWMSTLFMTFQQLIVNKVLKK